MRFVWQLFLRVITNVGKIFRETAAELSSSLNRMRTYLRNSVEYPTITTHECQRGTAAIHGDYPHASPRRTLMTNAATPPLVSQSVGTTGIVENGADLLEDGQEEVFSRAEVVLGICEHHVLEESNPKPPAKEQ
jgi:hypothetical protein